MALVVIFWWYGAEEGVQSCPSHRQVVQLPQLGIQLWDHLNNLATA